MNLAHRIDEVTKKQEFRRVVDSRYAILSSQYKSQLEAVIGPLPCQRIELEPLGLAIRDFPDIKTLWAVEPLSTYLDLADARSPSLGLMN